MTELKYKDSDKYKESCSKFIELYKQLESELKDSGNSILDNSIIVNRVNMDKVTHIRNMMAHLTREVLKLEVWDYLLEVDRVFKLHTYTEPQSSLMHDKDLEFIYDKVMRTVRLKNLQNNLDNSKLLNSFIDMPNNLKETVRSYTIPVQVLMIYLFVGLEHITIPESSHNDYELNLELHMRAPDYAECLSITSRAVKDYDDKISSDILELSFKYALPRFHK